MGTDQNLVWIGSRTGCEVVPGENPRATRYPLWIWWNLLSLDAPTVVCLWALFFMQALHMPFHYLDLALLTVAVWIIYAGDRTLDGLRGSREAKRSDRHNFYARHGYAVLGALLPLASASLWIGLTRLSVQTRAAGLVMCGVVGFYFLAVHAAPDRVARWFPKELIAGAIFATGAAIPAWSHAAESGKELFPAAVLFAGLCGLNCIAIECWEHHRGGRRWKERPYWLVRLGDFRIAQIAAALIVAAGLIGIFGTHSAGMAELLGAAIVSLSLIAALDWRSNDLSPQILRVLADAALLTPVFFLLKAAL